MAGDLLRQETVDAMLVGAVDLAALFHHEGDRRMAEAYRAAATGDMRIRDRVALAVRTRLECSGDKEAVRRGVTLFALPMHAADGARALWQTADAIWTALGDTSEDLNWYTKRATLSAVYSATVLYWLGDDSPESADTWAFLDRRIEDVMRIEKAKSRARENRLFNRLMAGPNAILGRVRAPSRPSGDGLPGGWVAPRR